MVNNSDTLIIRKLAPTDLKQWISLVAESNRRTELWANDILHNFKSEKKVIFVLEKNKKLIGFTGIKGEDNNDSIPAEFSNFARITWIAVLPQLRGQNYGSMLMDACKKCAIDWKYPGIWLACRDEVVAFYVHNGFVKSGIFNNDSGKKENLMVQRF